MSDFSDFKAQIADWANRQDWSDTLVTSFVRQAEQKLNAELRTDRMINFDEALVVDRCAPLPDDWLEFLPDAGVKLANGNGADGFLPIRYKSDDEFFNLKDGWAYGYYTIFGRKLYFGGTPDTVNGIVYKIAYFGEVPVFSDETSSLDLYEISEPLPVRRLDARGPSRHRRRADRGRVQAIGRRHDPKTECELPPRQGLGSRITRQE